MSTGSFENWAGEITEIGALFPFESSLPIWVIAAVVFWVVWQVSIVAIEQNRFSEEVKRNSAEKLKRMIKKKS